MKKNECLYTAHCDGDAYNLFHIIFQLWLQFLIDKMFICTLWAILAKNLIILGGGRCCWLIN